MLLVEEIIVIFPGNLDVHKEWLASILRVLHAIEPVARPNVKWPDSEERKRLGNSNDSILKGVSGILMGPSLSYVVHQGLIIAVSLTTKKTTAFQRKWFLVTITG